MDNYMQGLLAHHPSPVPPGKRGPTPALLLFVFCFLTTSSIADLTVAVEGIAASVN
jgi:hypothetical protein